MSRAGGTGFTSRRLRSTTAGDRRRGGARHERDSLHRGAGARIDDPGRRPRGCRGGPGRADDLVEFRFRRREPWPDFLPFYASATGAGWIVPKKYVEKVGDEGFKKAPIGAGPHRFVSFTPGVELVLEAVDQYWRKAPQVKRLVFRTIPDPSTRFAALKRGEIDVSYWMT